MTGLWARRHDVVPLLRGAWYSRKADESRRLRVRGPVGVNRPSPAGDSRLVLGKGVLLYQGVHFFLDAPAARIAIGERTYLNRRTEVCAKERVTIGADCAIAWDVLITDTDFHSVDGRPQTAPVHIGDRVWIGAKATVLKGVTVGDGAIVAAGALVSRDVPPGALVGGVPARVLREAVTWR